VAAVRSLPRLSLISFGATSAIVTSVGLIVGFGSAEVPKSAIVSGLLIVGLADNLTDTLSIHIFQESELLEQRSALQITIGNFLTRACIAGTFVILSLLLSGLSAVLACLAWGLTLLVGLTCLVARARRASVATELLKHITLAAIVVLASGLIGSWVGVLVH
jgi:VIT1/CCC1 family predicted Fe2+/Mn2+ transporter